MKLPSLLAPLFRTRFSWYYRQRYWVRFGITFGAGWLGFLALAQIWAMNVGEKKEALLFYTPEGAVLIAIFLIIFYFRWETVWSVVTIGVIWYFALTVKVTAEMLYHDNVNIERLKGRFAETRISAAFSRASSQAAGVNFPPAFIRGCLSL